MTKGFVWEKKGLTNDPILLGKKVVTNGWNIKVGDLGFIIWG
jgi:hypothetical protein